MYDSIVRRVNREVGVGDSPVYHDDEEVVPTGSSKRLYIALSVSILVLVAASLFVKTKKPKMLIDSTGKIVIWKASALIVTIAVLAFVAAYLSF